MVHAEGLSPLLSAAFLPKCSLPCPESSFQQSHGWEEELWGSMVWGRCSQRPPALGSSKQGAGGGLAADEGRCPVRGLGLAAWCSWCQGEAEQDPCSGQGCRGTLASTNPGLAGVLYLRLPVAQCCARAEDTHHLLAGCTAPASPLCPRKLVLSQSVASCSSPRTPALLAELI